MDDPGDAKDNGKFLINISVSGLIYGHFLRVYKKEKRIVSLFD